MDVVYTWFSLPWIIIVSNISILRPIFIFYYNLGLSLPKDFWSDDPSGMIKTFCNLELVSQHLKSEGFGSDEF